MHIRFKNKNGAVILLHSTREALLCATATTLVYGVLFCHRVTGMWQLAMLSPVVGHYSTGRMMRRRPSCTVRDKLPCPSYAEFQPQLAHRLSAVPPWLVVTTVTDSQWKTLSGHVIADVTMTSRSCCTAWRGVRSARYCHVTGQLLSRGALVVTACQCQSVLLCFFVRPSVRPSVCLSVCPLTRFGLVCWCLTTLSAEIYRAIGVGNISRRAGEQHRHVI